MSATSLASNRTDVVIHNNRALETARVTDAAREPVVSDGSVAGPSAGAFAQAAFTAGFAGLVTLLPDGCAQGRLIGMTHDEAGSLRPTHVDDRLPDVVAEELAADINGRLTGALGAWEGDQYFVAARATDDNGRHVGALVVVYPASELPWRSGVEPDTALQRELIAGMLVASAAYGRLLIDLLGEQPQRDPGAGFGEEAQSWS